MSEVQRLLERQARWQKSRQGLTWAEKIRMVEAIRESAIRLRATASRAISEERSRGLAPPSVRGADRGPGDDPGRGQGAG